MRPRTLVVPPSYFARERVVGGGERYALEYARALSRITPTTLALFDRNAGVEMDGSLEVRTFSVRRQAEGLVFPANRGALRIIGGYDVIHAMVFPTALTDLLLLHGALRRQPVILTDVGGGGTCLSNYLRKIHPAVDLNRLAAGLALLSHHSAQQFEKWRQPTTILYGGVDAATAPLAHEPGGHLLFVGRILPHKGVLELIEALDADVRLHVVGRVYDDEYARAVHEAAAGKNVHFFHDADDEALRAHYAGAAAVIQPTLPSPSGYDTSELLGLVTLEAMVAARPVIVTRSGSLPELIVDGVTGFVVAAGSGEELRRRVRFLMDEPHRAREMGLAGRRRALDRYSWDSAARRGLDLYRRVARRKDR